jgi:mRNA-degrading endonuclease toxin of MazEF toxin-antitoxin module
MAGLAPTIHVLFSTRGDAVSKRPIPLPNALPQGRGERNDRFDAFDIVVVPFPYVDRLAEKRRPALVISNRKLAPFGLIWVAMITSADNASWSCDVTIPDLTRAGLPAPSVVRTAKIACIEPARIERRAGRLDKATAKAVTQKLKGFLGG